VTGYADVSPLRIRKSRLGEVATACGGTGSTCHEVTTKAGRATLGHHLPTADPVTTTGVVAGRQGVWLHVVSEDSRRELGHFLRTRRARITPAEVGLPAGARRRAAGLRREEVAVLAGLSPTWYTYLEQGRDIHPSAQVLDSLARVLGILGR
jgi:DNA-binding XRE family transcriptional regulator